MSAAKSCRRSSTFLKTSRPTCSTRPNARWSSPGPRGSLSVASQKPRFALTDAEYPKPEVDLPRPEVRLALPYVCILQHRYPQWVELLDIAAFRMLNRPALFERILQSTPGRAFQEQSWLCSVLSLVLQVPCDEGYPKLGSDKNDCNLRFGKCHKQPSLKSFLALSNWRICWAGFPNSSSIVLIVPIEELPSCLANRLASKPPTALGMVAIHSLPH